jgi:hypothetical protein
MDVPETRYAKTSDGTYIAYQTAGEGPIDLVWQFDLIFGNVELAWETVVGDFLRELPSFSRLILHDRRGTGLSSRDVAPADLETRVGDLEVILDAIGSERPVLGGHGEGGASNVLFAHPGRSVFTRSCGPNQHHAPRGHPTTRGESIASSWNESPQRPPSCGAQRGTEQQWPRSRR